MWPPNLEGRRRPTSTACSQTSHQVRSTAPGHHTEGTAQPGDGALSHPGSKTPTAPQIWGPSSSTPRTGQAGFPPPCANDPRAMPWYLPLPPSPDFCRTQRVSGWLRSG